MNRTFKTTCAFKEPTDCVELGTSNIIGKCCRFITVELFKTYYTFHKGVKWKQNQTCLLVASTFVTRGGFFCMFDFYVFVLASGPGLLPCIETSSLFLNV